MNLISDFLATPHPNQKAGPDPRTLAQLELDKNIMVGSYMGMIMSELLYLAPKMVVIWR